MSEVKQKKTLVLVTIVYLAGIFMGAIDTGIVTPARTVIQNHLGVNEQTGIWMITIYTLAYASSIPIMGKLADKLGRKKVYLVSIFLFGIGSLFCGLSSYMDSFTMLLLARAVQAVGGGGIMPVATAEFGTTFPEEKVILCLDSQKTYRIFENLLNNIVKYALPGTRVYVEIEKTEKDVFIRLKNISATELTFNPEEITERFVRGDESRNPEGSGLGLANVKSFVGLQGGSFHIETDADLFKAEIRWALPGEETVKQEA